MPWRAAEGHGEGRNWGWGLASGPWGSGCTAAYSRVSPHPTPDGQRDPRTESPWLLPALHSEPHRDFKEPGPWGLWVSGRNHTAHTRQSWLRAQAPPGHLRSDRKHLSLCFEAGSQVKGPRRQSALPSCGSGKGTDVAEPLDARSGHSLARPPPRLGPGPKCECLISAEWAGGWGSGRRGPKRDLEWYQDQTGAGYTGPQADQSITMMTWTPGTSRPNSS